MSTAPSQLVGAAYLVHFSLLMLQRGGLISLLFPNPLLKLFFHLAAAIYSFCFTTGHRSITQIWARFYLGCLSVCSNLPASREADSELIVDAQALL